MEMNRIGLLLVLGIVLTMSIVSADSLQDKLNAICKDISTILPVVALVMIVLAGLVYAAGQVMGAEMRSRASVWATSLLVGAIIGLVLAASAKGIVQTFADATLIGNDPLNPNKPTINCQ